MKPNTDLSQISGFGPYLVKKLNSLGLFTVRDLIYHFPFRYDDFSNLSSGLEAQEGDKVTLVGEIWQINNIYTRSRKVLTKAIFNDGSGPIELTWFNSPWLTKSITVGDQLQISGKVSKFKNKISIVAPVWERIGRGAEDGGQGEEKNNSNPQPPTSDPLHTGRLVPIYPETEGLTSKWLRTKIAAALPQILPELEDPLPDSVRDSMLPLDEAIQKIHFPIDLDEVAAARLRLGFDELFFVQLATIKARNEWKNQPTIERLSIDDYRLSEFMEGLPFPLTGAQKRVIGELMADISKNVPMNRLVQGEVGSGKTVVAAVMAYLAYLNGLKTLYMAPTEILAFQHHSTLTRLLEPYGVNIGIYTGSRKEVGGRGTEKRRASSKKNNTNSDLLPPTSDPSVIVGTHALLSNSLQADNVGLVIVDEQQRFGVEQRSLLRSKARIPHFLTMTATPIPRTVALTLYGDLDISIIDELPKGRQKIQTHVVPNVKRKDAYKFIEKKVKEGDQVYIITPLIDFSETLASAKAATVEFEELQKNVFQDLKMGLLHGRLKSKEKEQVLNDFKDGKIQILVSTSVVEVGVDVSNATIMVIESAERFGLAQIHQLRGRVGRGSKQSFCLLFSSDKEAVSRLKNLESIDNGLKLAELDLKIRGSGQIFGKMQSGRMELKIASFTDLPLIEKSRAAATKVLEEDQTLNKFPLLKEKLSQIQGQIAPD
jgi:ATP-dependent DNA helicase RecG